MPSQKTTENKLQNLKRLFLKTKYFLPNMPIALVSSLPASKKAKAETFWCLWRCHSDLKDWLQVGQMNWLSTGVFSSEVDGAISSSFFPNRCVHFRWAFSLSFCTKAFEQWAHSNSRTSKWESWWRCRWEKFRNFCKMKIEKSKTVKRSEKHPRKPHSKQQHKVQAVQILQARTKLLTQIY